MKEYTQNLIAKESRMRVDANKGSGLVFGPQSSISGCCERCVFGSGKHTCEPSGLRKMMIDAHEKSKKVKLELR